MSRGPGFDPGEGGLPSFFTPMLATAIDKPFDSPEYLFEVKWDGVRTLAFCEKGRTRLYARSGREVTAQYPEVATIHEHLRASNAVFDGEIFAMGPQRRPSFERLQQRIAVSKPGDVARAKSKIPVDLVLFDLVFIDGEWIGGRPLGERLERMRPALDWGDSYIRSDVVPENGVALFAAASAAGLEGIVGKRIGSHYLPGKRTRDWLKVKLVKRASCVIGGWSAGGGSRSSTLGSLMLGVYEAGGLVFIGSVGTGFDEQMLAMLSDLLHALETPECPFDERPPVRGARWVKPELVCDVDYRELTSYRRLRAPSFKGLRDDIGPEDCRLESLT